MYIATISLYKENTLATYVHMYVCKYIDTYIWAMY